jgi:hypothetical protein
MIRDRRMEDADHRDGDYEEDSRAGEIVGQGGGLRLGSGR